MNCVQSAYYENVIVSEKYDRQHGTSGSLSSDYRGNLNWPLQILLPVAMSEFCFKKINIICNQACYKFNSKPNFCINYLSKNIVHQQFQQREKVREKYLHTI